MKKTLGFEESSEYVINNFYSLNYACLRIAYQDGITPHTGNIFTRDDIFGSKRIKNSWINSKLFDAADERNKEIVEFIKMMEEENIITESAQLYNYLETSKLELITQYNKVFETNYSFDEVFDGFFCKGADLDKLITLSNNCSKINKSIESSKLVQLYCNYQEILKTYMVVESMIMIVDALTQDVSKSGTPTLQYGISNQNILEQLSANELAQYCDKAYLIKDSIALLSEDKRKHLSQLIKLQHRRKITHTEKLIPQIESLKNELFDLNCDSNYCEILLKQLKKFESRFLSANKNYQNSEICNSFEKFIDFLLNIETKSDEFSVDSIYITKTEKNYLEYLFSQLKHHSLNKATNKTNETQQQNS